MSVDAASEIENTLDGCNDLSFEFDQGHLLFLGRTFKLTDPIEGEQSNTA